MPCRARSGDNTKWVRNILALAQHYLEDDRLVREPSRSSMNWPRRSRATAHLAVLAGGDLVIVAKEPSPEQSR